MLGFKQPYGFSHCGIGTVESFFRNEPVVYALSCMLLFFKILFSIVLKAGEDISFYVICDDVRRAGIRFPNIRMGAAITVLLHGLP
jgi:hypothetical protein